MVKVLCILYKGGKHAEEQPRLLGTVENALGLKEYMKQGGHQFVVTDLKDGADSEFAKHIVDADVVITTPFHPAYLTAEILSTAKKLKLCITAGVGSDHVDLNKANELKITVAEVTGSNVVSVAEHVVMTMLCLVRNYNVGHQQVFRNTDWNVAAVASNAYDIEGKTIGTLGAGRIGIRVLERLRAFNPSALLYYDYQDLAPDVAAKVGARRVEKLEDFLSQCDIVTINCPLHEGTHGLINKSNVHLIKGWLVNTARGAICDADAIADAVKAGTLLGYGGDVWNKQPAPTDHPWRNMQGPAGDGIGNCMTPHYSGTTLDAQKRYADGTKIIFDNWLNGNVQDPVNIIVEGGAYASKAYGQR